MTHFILKTAFKAVDFYVEGSSVNIIVKVVHSITTYYYILSSQKSHGSVVNVGIFQVWAYFKRSPDW